MNPINAVCRSARTLGVLLALMLSLSANQVAFGQQNPDETLPRLLPPPTAPGAPAGAPADAGNAAGGDGGNGAMVLPDFSDRRNFSSALQILIMLTVLSLAPSILLMMTSFTRIIIVMALLRQALGTQQLPPNQVLIGLALFMTIVVMTPTWQEINQNALTPYMDGQIDQPTAMKRAEEPLRKFMIGQIVRNGNDEDILLFTDFAGRPAPQTYGEVSTFSLVPAFMLSELKTAFLLGFKVYLPFLVIDMVIATILISMGMMMLPPVLISLPFKLLLFVLVDGWRLITAGLMGTFTL